LTHKKHELQKLYPRGSQLFASSI